MDFYFYYNIDGESDRPMHDTKIKQSIALFKMLTDGIPKCVFIVIHPWQ